MKYRKSTLIFVFCMMFGAILPLRAQVTVSGTVVDAKTGTTLPGVNILVKGTQRGTITDATGNFSFSVPTPKDTLIFSYIGYHTQTIPVNGRTTINVEMKQSISKLGNLVVIGYGREQKQDATGSVTSISSKDFKKGNITSMGELFQGKAAGVSVTSGSGAPGSGPTIRIRTGSSISASNSPLYVVDGVPLTSGGVSGMHNPLNTINPGDIKNISILKGASATAIYGSRASNGVIIITTKKGSEGQPLTINYTGKFSYETPTNLLQPLSVGQFRSMIKEKFGSNGTQYLGNDTTHWQNRIYRNSFKQNHHLSFSGGTQYMPYRFSLGYTGDNGILKTSRNGRLTGDLSLSPSLFNDQLTINLNLKGSRVKNRFANKGAIGSALRSDPTKPVKISTNAGANAPYGGYFTWLDSQGNPITIAPANPVAQLNQTHDKSTVYQSIGNVKFTLNVPHISNLSAILNLGYQYSFVGNGQYVVPQNAGFAYNGESAYGGTLRNYTQHRHNQLLDFYLKYDKFIKPTKSRIKFTAGYSWEHHYQDATNYSTNYNRADTLVINADTRFKTEHYIISFFGRLNYTFNEKYLLTATLREDGTSRFAPGNRWGTFPSAAIAWKMAKEPFLINSGVVTQLKLRFGYGITGEQRINQGNFPYLARYNIGQPTAAYQFGDSFVRTLRPEGYNSSLKWEQTTTYDLGLDYGFFDGRLTGSFDIYDRVTNDLLNVVPVAAGTNFTNLILSNIGRLKIQGVEFNITGQPIRNETSSLEISFNVTHNQSTIEKLTTGHNPDYIGVETGGISGGTGNTIQLISVGYPRTTFYVYQQVFDKQGKPLEGVYVDQNGDGIINNQDKIHYKGPAPEVIFGLSARYTYKNWDASFGARAEVGNYVYNNVESNMAFSADMLYTQYLSNSIQSIYNTNFKNAQYHSSYYVQNASFLKLDNLTVGYTFNKLFSDNQSLRISATVHNVFTITDYDGVDPEVFSGIDNNLYPRPRVFTLGISLNFQ